MWRGFKQRNPWVKFRTPQSMSAKRMNVSAKDVKQWFHDIDQYLIEADLIEVANDPARIFMT